MSNWEGIIGGGQFIIEMPDSEVNITLNGCLGICDWNSGMILMRGNDKISDFIKSVLKKESLGSTPDFLVHLDKQSLFPKLLVLELDVEERLGSKILALISQFIKIFPTNWFDQLKSASLVLHDGQVFLGLDRNPGGSQLIEFRENIILENGDLKEGYGEIICTNGIFKKIKSNETIISRPNSSKLLWNPIVMSYPITSWSQSTKLSVDVNKVSLSISCTGLQSAYISIKSDTQPTGITISPNNLAHSSHIKSSKHVLWRIEAVSPGSTYSLILHSAKIIEMEMSATIQGSLLSNFPVKELYIDGISFDTKDLARVSYATEIKETLAM